MEGSGSIPFWGTYLLHWLYSPRGPWPFLQFIIILQTVGLLGRVISSSQGLYLIYRTTQTQNKHIHQTSMPFVGFEPTIPASERAKTVHALDSSATVTGILRYYSTNFREGQGKTMKDPRPSPESGSIRVRRRESATQLLHVAPVGENSSENTLETERFVGTYHMVNRR
jgi:hypothetical protein